MSPDALQTLVATHRTLEEALHCEQLRLVDLIVQDEFTHDVVFAAGDQFVVYDTT
jgi:hypothetical protein